MLILCYMFWTQSPPLYVNKRTKVCSETINSLLLLLKDSVLMTLQKCLGHLPTHSILLSLNLERKLTSILRFVVPPDLVQLPQVMRHTTTEGSWGQGQTHNFIIVLSRKKIVEKKISKFFALCIRKSEVPCGILSKTATTQGMTWPRWCLGYTAPLHSVPCPSLHKSMRVAQACPFLKLI